MKPTVSGRKLYIYISQEEIEQMIKEKLFMKNEPTDAAINAWHAVTRRP